MERTAEQGTYQSSVAGGTTNGIALLLGGIGIGALLMYLFDPNRGRGRRAQLSDQLASKVNDLGEAAEGRARDLRNRAKGVMHEVSSILPGGRDTQSEESNEPTAEPARARAANAST